MHTLKSGERADGPGASALVAEPAGPASDRGPAGTCGAERGTK